MSIPLPIINNQLTITNSMVPAGILASQFSLLTNSQALVVTNASYTGEAQNIVSGSAAFLNANWSVTVESDSDSDLSIRFSAPSGTWTFSTSFPNLPIFNAGSNASDDSYTNFLDQLAFTSPIFVLTSATGSDSGSGAPLLPGLNFIANGTPGPLLGIIGSMIAGSQPVQIYGTILLPAAWQITPPLASTDTPWTVTPTPPGIFLTASLLQQPQTLFSNVSLNSADLLVYTPITTAWSNLNQTFPPALAASVDLEIGSTTLNVLAVGIDSSAVLSLFGDFTQSPFSSLDLFEDILGANLMEDLPSEVQKALSDLLITSLSLQIGMTGSYSLMSVGIGLALADDITFQLPVLGELIISGVNTGQSEKAQGPTLDLTVNDPLNNRVIGLAVSGSVEIEGVTLDVEMSFEDSVYAFAMTAAPTPLDLLSFVKFFARELSLPTDWGSFTISEFDVSVDTANKIYSVNGTFDLALSLFGSGPDLLDVENAMFNVQYAAGKWQGSFQGTMIILGLGLQVSAIVGDTTVLTVRLTDHTLGDLLSYMLSFISSGDFVLEAPWSVLNDIQLSDFVLIFDITNKKVTFEYDANEDFGFIQISAIGITYDYSITPITKAVSLALGGDFMGASYPLKSSNSPLAWAPLAEPAPSVPGKSTLLDLRLLGFGQRLEIEGASEMTHVSQAITAIEKSFTLPTGGENLPPELLVNGDSGWIIGADFTVLDTVAISVIFDDPQLFGLAISLTGAKAGIFNGLSFEVMYKEVSPGVGEYSIWLTLPKAMQRIELGEIVITLPVLGLSIYTNGNFVVDLGYPYNNDYTKSFGLDIFPFVGSGGLYFGYLSSATAGDLVPDTNNTGTFNPIFELGFALRVGVGYDGTFGPLSFSVGLVVTGGLVGVLAFFHPYDPGYSSSTFFSLQGSIGLSGWLKGGINFGAVSASIDVELDALASLTYISYQPMLISFSVEVKAAVQAKVLFINVHFSFDHTFTKTFSIGSVSLAPWQTLPPRAPAAPRLLSFDALSAVQPNQWTWPANFAYPLPTGFSPSLYIAPIITAAADSGTPSPRIVSALFVQNPNPADLTTPNYISGTTFGILCQAMLAWGLSAFLGKSDWETLQTLNVSAIDLERMHSMLTAELDVEVFMQQGFTASEAQQVLNSLLMQGYIDTNNRVILPVPTSIAFPNLDFITNSEAQAVLQILTQYSQPVQLFSETDLEEFIATLLGSAPFIATPRPTDADSTVQTTIFPLPPALSFSASGAAQAITNQPISDPAGYNALLTAFFMQTGSPVGNMIPPDQNQKDPSVAAMVFRDYFYLLLTSAVDNARMLMTDFPHSAAAGDTLSGIAAQYGITNLEELLEANLETEIFDTTDGWLAVSDFQQVISAGMTLQSALNGLYVIPPTGESVSALIDISSVSELNQSLRGLLQPGQVITVPNVSFTPQNSPTLTTVSAAFANPTGIIATNGVTLIASAPLPALTPLQLTGIRFMVVDFPAFNTVNAIAQYFGISPADLRIQNPGLPAEDDSIFPDAQQITIASVSYIVPPNDLASIEQYFAPVDAASLQPVIGTALTLTARYTVQPGDSLFSIAAYLGISVEALTGSIGALLLTPNIRLNLPPFAHKLAASETFATLAHSFNLSLASLANLNKNTTPFFAAKAMLDIPANLSVGALVQALDAQARQAGGAPGTAAIAQAMNRYMLNGLRLPLPPVAGASVPNTPEEWIKLPVQPLYSLTGQQFDVPTPIPASISLTLNSNIPWVQADNLTVTLMPDEMALVSGAVAQLNALAPAMPQVLSGWQSSPARFSFGASQTWLAAEPQAFATAVPQQSPLIWQFSSDLVAALQSSTGLQLSPYVGRSLAAPTGYAWGALITLPLRPARTVSGSSGAAGNVYNVSVDDAMRTQLKAILGWLSATNTISLSIVYPSGSTQRSDIAGDTDRQTISVVALDSVAVPFAQLSDPQAFLQVLTVGSYLDYQTVATPDGLPAALFANQVQASVSLLVTIQTASVEPVPNWCNTLFTTGNISASGAALSVVAPTLTSDKFALQPGSIGFHTTPVAAPDDTQSIAQLYQMLSYQQVAEAGPPLNIPGAPIPPAQPKNSASTDWMYKKAIPLTSPSASNSFSPTPPAAANPYALVTAPLNYQFYSFSLVDLFGNQVQPATLGAALPLPLGYFDTLIGVEGWASTSMAYFFGGDQASPTLNLILNFSAAKYQLGPDQALQTLLMRLNTDLQTMAQVYYQIHQPDVTFNLESSIGSVGTWDIKPVQAFVDEIYAYIATLIALNENHGLTQSVALTQSGDTLMTAAQRTRTNPAALAAMNRNITGLPLADSVINLPVTYSVMLGDTPQSIAAAQKTTPDALGTLNAAAALNAGVSLNILSGTYTTLKGDTLASIAQGYGAQNVSPAQIASANSLSALWAAGTVLISSVTAYTVNAADSFYSILQQSAGQTPQPTLDTLLQANAISGIALSESVALLLPQHSQLESASLSAGMSVQTVSSASALADLEANALDQMDLWYANANRADILASGTSVTLTGTFNNAAITIPVTIQPNDTPQTFYSAGLAAIAAAVLLTQAQNNPGTFTLVLGQTSLTLSLIPYISAAQVLGQLQAQLSASDFAVLVSTQKIIRAGATLLVPPKAATLTADIVLKLPYTFSEITASFVLQRDAKLVNPHLGESIHTRVVRAATAAAPWLSDASTGTSYSQQNLSLAHFATQFQALFPGYLVATQPKQANSAPPLWAVPLGADSVDYIIRPETGAYFLNPPLSTKLIAQAGVSVPAYTSGVGLKQHAAQVNYQGIDMDGWAQQFLGVFDQLMSPQALSTIYSSSPADFAQLLNIRETLVENITKTVQPVVSVSDPNLEVRQQAARNVFTRQLDQALINAYRVDSIVQFATEVNGKAPNIPAIEKLSMNDLAALLHIPLLEFMAANYACNMLENGAPVKIDITPAQITSTNLQAWFNSMDATDQAKFIDVQHVPIDTSDEMKELGNAVHILVNPSGGQIIGKGLYTTSPTLYGVLVSMLGKPDTSDLVTISAALSQLGGFAPQPFYVAQMVKDVPGLFNHSTIPEYVITGSNPAVTFGPTDTLQSIYDANFANQQANQQPLSLWDLVMMSLKYLKVDLQFAQQTLYFDWITLSGANTPNTDGLTYIGKPLNSAYTLPASLHQIADDYKSQAGFALAVDYVGDALAEQPGIFNGTSISGIGITPTATDTLQSIYAEQTVYKSYSAFVTGIATDSVLAAGQSLPLFWQNYGQPLTLALAASALSVDVSALVWSNYKNSVWLAQPGDTQTETLSQEASFWASVDGPPYPAASMPTLIYESGHLVNTPALGVLTYPGGGLGNLAQPILPAQSFNDFANAIMADTAVFIPTYIGEIIKNVTHLFTNAVINNSNPNNSPASYTAQKSDTLVTLAKTFGFNSDEDMAQFIVSYGDQLVMQSGSLIFQWTSLSDAVQPPTIQQMADYFNVSAEQIIEASWEKPNFIQAGVTIGGVQTVSSDTLSSLSGKMGHSTDYPPPARFYNDINIIQNAQLFIPFSQPGILVLQAGLALTSASSNMADGVSSYLTFLLSQSGEPQARVGVDLAYQPYAVQADATLMGGASGMQLQLLAPPVSTHIGSTEVPIPLRSYPNAPTLTDQSFGAAAMGRNANIGEERPMLPISQANEWMYSFGYTYQGSAQDETQVSLVLNAAANAAASASTAAYNELLFQSLAGFITVLPELVADLNQLPQINGASTSPSILNAIQSFITLAAPIAQNWKLGHADDMQNLTPATPAGPAAERFAFTVQELYDAENNHLLITVTAPSGQTLPGRYALPLIQPDPTLFSTPNVSPPTNSTQAIYSFKAITPGANPDNGKRTVIFDNAFNVLQYGSAAGQLDVLRNQNLLYGVATTPAFVYQTPAVTFQQPIKPMIDHDTPVAFYPLYRLATTLEEQYSAYLAQMLSEMYGADISALTDELQIQIAIGYRMALANTGVAALTVLIPLAIQARSALNKDFSQKLGAKLAELRAAQQFNGGQFEFDIAIYTGDNPQPVLRLQEVQMPLDAAPIQSQRFAAEPDPGQTHYATDLDAVNPLVTNASRFTDVTINTVTRRYLTYGDPIKLKSWFSGMVWADNTTIYYNAGLPARSRQNPIYADPIIALYVCQLDSTTLLPGQAANYLDYFSQGGGDPTDTDIAVYVQPGWEAGFHLSMPNPTMSNSAAFNSGTGLKTYNNDALIFNPNVPGANYQTWAESADQWIAATTEKPFAAPPSFKDFSTTDPLVTGTWQAGLCQYAVWRDTLSISPVALVKDVPTLAFAPAAARLDDQGAFHARFVMENETDGAPHQLLSMTVIQGSPLTQFTGAGIDGAHIAGIFAPPGSPQYFTPGGIHPNQAARISGLANADGSAGALDYIIIYQQVNLFHSEHIPETGSLRMNWVSFAIFWDSASTTAQIDPNNQAVTLLFNQPQADNFFVVAGLPNQMANTFNSETDLYDSVSAEAWAQQIAQTAFNYIASTQVTYDVGQDRSGNAVASNQVYTNYLYTFEQVGPVSAPDQTVILLQPHQYLDPFNTRGTVLQPGDLQPLFSGSLPGNDSYWMARGRLWAQRGADFSIVYTYPNMLPNLPLFPTGATLPSNAATPAPPTYTLIEMAAAMLGTHWVSDFTNAVGNTQNAPATTGMADTENMQDTYNAAKSFYRAAKMLPMLLSMTESGYFNSQDVMDHINGTTVYNGGTSYYAVGANIQNGKPVYFTPGGALHDFVEHLIEAFDYYFGGTPLAYISRAFTSGQLSGKSFYYSYYDPNNHHVFLYPASGAGGIWPTNRSFSPDAKIFDGYGTVSMLNDHAYTYGYLISAASVLSMVLKTDLSKLHYTTINGSTGKMGGKAPVATAEEYKSWLNWFDGIKPVIDALMMDLAYTPGVDTGDAQGFAKFANQTYPEMEFLDQWTGISWTDGFLLSGSTSGHNANSPWEEMLAWVGMIQWGNITGRKKVADLGIYLYTTALYSLEYYNYNVTQNYLPLNNTADASANGDFIPRATNNFDPAFSFYENQSDTSGPANPLTDATQPFVGRAMTETTISDSAQGELNNLPGIYNLSGGKDHRTAHVTYFYQGNVRSDNTYWNSPVGMLSTAIYPHGAFSLALSRHAAYMADWVNAINFQNGRSYFQSFYPTVVNLLSAMLGQTVTLESQDVSSQYYTLTNANPPSTDETKIIPIPAGEHADEYGYSPTDIENPANPQANAFVYLTINNQLKPYNWYWNKAANINTHQVPADDGTPPWQSVDTGETLSMYVPGDVTEAEYLLYFYSYDAYGQPDFSRTLNATWTASTIPATPLLPMSAAWRKVVAVIPFVDAETEDITNPGDGSHPRIIEKIQWTYMVYNPNSHPITVSFADASGGSSQPQSIDGYQMFFWTET